MNREELAWAAGFFDGEGCILAYRRKKLDGSRRELADLRFAVVQTDLRPLQRFHEAIGGIGTIREVVPSGFGKKRKWQLQIYRHEHVQAVVAMLWAFLSAPKQEQIVKALTVYNAGQLDRQRPWATRRGELA